MLRTTLHADPTGIFLHDAVLSACRQYAGKTALVDTSCIGPPRRISYAEFGEMIELAAKGFVALGIKPGDVIAIYLPNSWEYAVAYHAATLAGAIPTLLNPSYREREVRYQLENSGAAMLISDGPNFHGMNLSGLPNLRRVFTTRQDTPGAQPFASLLTGTGTLSSPAEDSEQTLAALPYSSGTTGLPKGVMLSHFNLVANIFQIIAPHGAGFVHDDVLLCFLPLYHIYGLNVLLNPALALGATILTVPRFNVPQIVQLIESEGVTTMPTVPPALIALCQAAEAGQFPSKSTLRWVKSGAAPLAPELARRFTALTGVLVCQGYGMTEASPVTHLGYLDPALYKPESIGQPVAKTDCRVLDLHDNQVAPGEPGELVMRGPQFTRAYWKDPQATAAALRDGWYWSGDIAIRDENNFYSIVDRRKEMIKYKGFPVAPAEIESVLLEHPAVRECGVVGRADALAGEVPVAFIALRDQGTACDKLKAEICAFVGERLTNYKQPREVRFVDAVPKTA